MFFSRVIFILALAFFSFAYKTQAQQPFKLRNYIEILEAFKKFETAPKVLYIAAHPDDENTRLLAYFSNEKQYRTAYLSLTRGGGGQNLIGDELGNLLGIIRTHELLEARKIDGAMQYFTKAIDFGYSKTAKESIDIWGEDEILYDIVWVIRSFRPDIIITRFPPEGRSHGHHIASAQLALKAFGLSGKKDVYPDQLSQVEPWKAKKIYWNTYRFGNVDTTSEDQAQIDVGIYNAYLGLSYPEIAAKSRSMHKSQGFGSAPRRGSTIEYFSSLTDKKNPDSKDIFQGIPDSFYEYEESLAEVKAWVDLAKNLFIVNQDQEAIDQLFKARNFILASKKAAIYDYKVKELERLIIDIAGLWHGSFTKENIITKGSTIDLDVELILQQNIKSVTLEGVSYKDLLEKEVNKKIKFNTLQSYPFKITIGGFEDLTNPYWLKNIPNRGTYNVQTTDAYNKAKLPPLTFYLTFDFWGNKLSVSNEMICRRVSPTKGEYFKKINILPPIILRVKEDKILFVGNELKQLTIELEAVKTDIEGKIELFFPRSLEATTVNKTFKFNKNKRKDQVTVNINRAFDDERYIRGEILPVFKSSGGSFNLNSKSIDYPHLPNIYYFEEAYVKVSSLDIKVPKRKIAYIAGAGDRVADELENIGYQVTHIDENLLSAIDLSKYHALIMGIRAYNTNNWLHRHYNKLMNYLKKGGKIIVQYNTHNFLSKLNGNIGPAPFKISRKRVSEEDAPVTILDKKNRLFNHPNKIEEADWEDWVQERGLYFADQYDGYDTFLAMNDIDENPLKGSIIGKPLGQGYFFYTGLSFFRQLPASVEGAFKLLVNMIEYNPSRK